MKIANPLYDHALKYLMSNDRLAKKVLPVILDMEVLELELAEVPGEFKDIAEYLLRPMEEEEVRA